MKSLIVTFRVLLKMQIECYNHTLKSAKELMNKQWRTQQMGKKYTEGNSMLEMRYQTQEEGTEQEVM